MASSRISDLIIETLYLLTRFDVAYTHRLSLSRKCHEYRLGLFIRVSQVTQAMGLVEHLMSDKLATIFSDGRRDCP